MESETFEPAVRTDETAEVRIVTVDLPGFRKEDLKVQIVGGGDIVISGERRLKEIEETTNVEGRLEKMKRRGDRFRKVIAVPERNLNYNGITAMFSNERLCLTLPLLRISDQRNQDAVPAGGKPDQSVQSKFEWSSRTGQEDSMKERSGVAEDNQRARQPEAIRRDDDKEKASEPVEESKGLVEERKTEAPKHARDFDHGEPPIPKEAIRERSDDQRARHQEPIRPDDHQAKTVGTAGESKDLVKREKAEAPKHAQDFVGGAPVSKGPIQERSAVAKVEQSSRRPEPIRPDDHKAKPVGAAEESKELVKGEKAGAPKHAQDFVGGASISEDPIRERSAVAKVEQSARIPSAIRPDAHKEKPVGAAGESKELVEGEKEGASKHARDFVGRPPISKDPVQERSAVAKIKQSATHPEAIRPDNDKAKPNAAVEASKELLGGLKEEVPKHAQDIVGAGALISEIAAKEQSAVAQNDQSARHPEFVRPDDYKAAPIEDARESAELQEEKRKEAKQAKDFVQWEPSIPTHEQVGSPDQSQSIKSKSKQDEEKPQQEVEEDDEETDEGEEADDEEEDGEDEGDECSLTNGEFPVKIIHIPPTGRSVFSKEKVLFASTVLVLSAGLYLSYILRSQSSD